MFSFAGFRKCREQWPKEAEGFERFYNIFLVLALLVLPLVILCVAYILITRTLYVDIQDEKNLILGYRNNSSGNSVSDDGKMYTQVMMEVNPPTVFHFNMSFRYHARKTATTGCCASNSRTLQVVQTTANSDRETEHLTTTGMIRKYSTKNNRRRGLCYRSAARTGAEAEISLPDSKEVVIQQTAPSSSQPHSNGMYKLWISFSSTSNQLNVPNTKANSVVQPEGSIVLLSVGRFVRRTATPKLLFAICDALAAPPITKFESTNLHYKFGGWWLHAWTNILDQHKDFLF